MLSFLIISYTIFNLLLYLFIYSNISLFPNWIHTLRVYLESSGLSDIIPDANSYSTKRVTSTEEQKFIPIFFNYVSHTSYPEWLVSCFQKNMHPYDIVNHSLALCIQRCNVTTILKNKSSIFFQTYLHLIFITMI